jgi:1,4-alpha-glucan branching enzyme
VSVVVQDGPYWEVDDTVVEQDLAKDGDYWSATVPGVQAWQLYRFKLEPPGGGVIERLDPAARDVLSSELTRSDPSSRNGSVVPGTDPFPWAPFETPRFENFIIYECHIGSFAGRGDHFNKSWATFQDVESKFSYIREMGFNCIEPLPVHEYHMDRS